MFRKHTDTMLTVKKTQYHKAVKLLKYNSYVKKSQMNFEKEP